VNTSASPAGRAIIVGLDGASMEIVKHMVDHGHAPNLGQLIATGSHREMLGVLPTLTPPGWTSMMTGCWPGSHQVTDFNIRALGRPLDEMVWGINTGLCRREYLWNAAERANKIPILVKFEMSWPPTIQRGVQIEGCGPGISNLAQIAGYHYFSNVPPGSEQASTDSQLVDPSTIPFDDRYDPVTPRPAEGWRNLPPAGPPPLEVELMVRPALEEQNKAVVLPLYADVVNQCNTDLATGLFSKYMIQHDPRGGAGGPGQLALVDSLKAATPGLVATAKHWDILSAAPPS
jgi:hypothetical protein